MERKRTNLIWGVFLIVIGIIFLIGTLSSVGMGKIWPIFPLTVGLAFWVAYFHDRENPGLLMPGSILVVISILFFYCTFSDWGRMETLWPFFIIAPAVGFFAMYFGGAKDQGLLLPAGVLLGVGVIFLLLSSWLGNYWPVFVIIGGIILIALQRLPGKKQEKEGTPQV